MHFIAHYTGTDSVDSRTYAFWSGIGGDISELAILIAIVRSYFKLKHQKDRHQQQLKDHIDYKFGKLTEKVDD